MTAPEQPEKFFAESLRQLRQENLGIHNIFLRRAEEEFKRLGYREEISAGVENILIVRLDAVGDMILTSGFLREIRKNFPTARITLVCSSLVYPVVELCPYVNEVLPFDPNKLGGRPFRANIFFMLEVLTDFCRENFWRKNFSIAFSPQWGGDNWPGLFMCWLSGARERIGYGKYSAARWGFEPPAEMTTLENFLLTKKFLTPHTVVSEVEKLFYLLQTAGLTVNQTHTELFFDATDFLRARELMKNIPSTTKKVLLGLGAGIPNRKYPAEKYLLTLKELAKKNLAFVIVGGKSEQDDANFLEKNLPRGKVLNLVGQTTLRETEAVISQMNFYLGGDSGVMHMAAAAQIPVLVLYREAADKENFLPGVFSEVQRFPPWQTKAVILQPDRQLEECAKREAIYGWCHAAEPHCITQITPQEIIKGFEVLEEL